MAAELALKGADTRRSFSISDCRGSPAWTCCAHARRSGNKTPVLILTARDAVEDRIKGLDRGADDYMVKPFDLHELAARLRALVRRSRGEAAPRLRVGEIELDPARACVSSAAGRSSFPPREFALLHELMLNAGPRAVARAIRRALYAWGEEIESNAIEVHIHHLRRKLAPELIRTVRGVGYLMPRRTSAGAPLTNRSPAPAYARWVPSRWCGLATAVYSYFDTRHEIDDCSMRTSRNRHP